MRIMPAQLRRAGFDFSFALLEKHFERRKKILGVSEHDTSMLPRLSKIKKSHSYFIQVYTNAEHTD